MADYDESAESEDDDKPSKWGISRMMILSIHR